MQIQKNVDNKQPQVKFANVISVSRYIKHKYTKHKAIYTMQLHYYYSTILLEVCLQQ